MSRTSAGRRTAHTTAAAVLLLSVALVACGERAPEHERAAIPPDAALAAHTEEFERRVYHVTDGVHVAVGYGLANSILIEGTDGVIIVDTMESLETAAAVKAAFDRITRKPVRAIIYTHNHSDHIFGARAFVEGAAPPVYAHETTNHYIDQATNVLRPAIYRRSMRMFGNYLPPALVLNAGIGPVLRAGHGGGTPALIRPTHTFSDALALTIAGVHLELVHAPGETDDQIFVWLPEHGVLMPGDNFYKAFPNLYTIRGTPYRDVRAWVASLDAMRARRPRHLVPSHTRPLSGADEIHATLTDYRDAIQFVHDQTVRGINKGLTPEELVETVRLPAHLARKPYLQEYYGTVEWSVRSIFTGYLGWFGGSAAYLSPHSPDERAKRLAALAATGAPLLEQARQALAEQDYRWAAELADNLIRVEPDRAEAREILAAALEQLGAAHRSANGRHYYLTQAAEVAGEIAIEQIDLSEVPLELVNAYPLRSIMMAMAVNLDAGRCLETDRVVGFRFPDVDEAYTIHVRRGIADVQPVFPQRPDVAVTMDATVWREILTGRRNPAVAFVSGDVTVEGSTLELIQFLRLFDRG